MDAKSDESSPRLRQAGKSVRTSTAWLIFSGARSPLPPSHTTLSRALRTSPPIIQGSRLHGTQRGEAKRHLPGWQWAIIHAAALPKSGGRGNARTVAPSEIERMALASLDEASCSQLKDKEIVSAWKKVGQWFSNAAKKKQPTDSLVRAALHLASDLHSRGLKPSAGALKTMARLADPSPAWRRMEISKQATGELRGVLNRYLCNLLGRKPRMHRYLGMLAE